MRWLTGLLMFALAACTSCSSKTEKPGGPPTIRVAAASDLAKAFADVGAVFEKQTGNKLQFDFGSSGLLAKQIEQGAPYQLFAAANKSFVDQVIKAGKCDASTMSLYSRGRVVLWGKSGSPARLEDLADSKYTRIGLANPDHAPYGNAARQALQKAGIYDKVKDRLVLADNVQAAATYAREGSVDVAFFALSLAITNDAKGYLAIDPDLHDPLEQTLVVCGTGPASDAAKKLAQFITGDQGRAVMERYGFSTTGVVPRP